MIAEAEVDLNREMGEIMKLIESAIHSLKLQEVFRKTYCGLETSDVAFLKT